MTDLSIRELGSGPAALLLHAFPCDGRMWLPQAEALAEAGWRVLVPDLPGFGASRLLDGEPSLADVARTLLAELTDRDIDRCLVAGVSLGGYVSLALLRERPEVIAGLALCDTKATADGEEARANRERLAGLVEQDPEASGRILEQAVLPGLLGDTSRQRRSDVVELVRGWLYEAPAAAVAWYQRAMAVRPDSRALLADAGVPALVVWGDEDTLSPRAEQDLMLEQLTQGELVVVEDAGHLANVERPDIVAEALVSFAATVRGPQTS